MKAIIANLKLYLPNRYFWPTYFSGAVILYIFMISLRFDQKRNHGLLISAFACLHFYIGYAATMMQINIFTKPFSFCLPGHKQNAKLVLFIIGIVTCLVMAFVVVFVFKLNPMIIPVIFFANKFFYWIGVGVSFFIRWILAVIMPLTFLSFAHLYPYELLGGFIVNHSLLVICIGLISSIFAWLILNPFDLARRFCGVPLLTGIFDFYNKEKIEKYSKYKQALKKEKMVPSINPYVEKFFLNGMKKHDFFSLGRYIWGSVYIYAFPMEKYKPVWILFLAAIFCLYSYFMSFSVVSIFAMVIFFVAFSPVPLFSTMLVSDGRKERFYNTLYVACAACVSIMIPLFLGCLMSVIVAPYMPALNFEKLPTIVFRALSFKFCFIPLFIVPFVYLFKVMLYKKRALQLVTLFVLYILFVIFATFIGSHLKVSITDVPDLFLNPISILSLTVPAWFIFIAALRHVCFKKSLI